MWKLEIYLLYFHNFNFFNFPKEEETDNEENFIDLNILKAQTYHLVSFIGYTQDRQYSQMEI